MITGAMQSDKPTLRHPAELRITARSMGIELSPKGTCTRCGVERPATALKEMGRRLLCKKCLAAIGTAWRPLNEKADALSLHYKAKYGLTLQEYGDMFLLQCGQCAICEREPAEGEKLYVDHNHVTGEVRGLLCPNCNTGIGLLQDNARILASAILYLTR